MKNSKLNVGSYVFVLGNDRSVCEAKIVDNSKWGEGYVTVELEDGRTTIADSDRCFRDQFAAVAASESDKISSAIIN